MAITAAAAWRGKKAAANRTWTGSFAPQLMKGIIIIVSIRSRGLFRVRAAMIAGTEQPKPSIMGKTDWPWSPKAWRARSVAKAALDM